MIELKFREQPDKKSPDTSSGCGCGQPPAADRQTAGPCCSPVLPGSYPWIMGEVMTGIGPVPKISTGITRTDYLEHVRCRVSAFRNNYTVPPGLYAAGEPDKNSDVFVSANYKLSFDALRGELANMNAWLLVLDTKGINVWCAAGKGSFGTDELARRISMAQLSRVVEHRRLIVPQLGAPGLSAYKLKQKTGFQVRYGPVRAQDITAFIRAGYKATRQMRTVEFSMADRLVLTPMEIRPALKYYAWFALITLAVFGLQPSGILFKDALTGASPFLLFGLLSVLSGAFITPLLLPFLPFRSFAVKGWIAGMLSLYAVVQGVSWRGESSLLLTSAYLFFPAASSYIALQFTGSTTFTGMAGVKKELRISLPVYSVVSVVSVLLLAGYKLVQWRVL